jgi:lysozyme family protein
MLQKAVGATQDGQLGPMTLEAIKEADDIDTVQKLHWVRQDFYEGLKHFKQFGKGWTRRNGEVAVTAQNMIEDNA